ncbi:hypothetical protein SKAU_G00006080 [Synaphobranchus kaupii]|uniref:Uncharacterized protein n=1 Tax=Synaphobranchus kaupii TaxID=118154 RepID=A0A9Q1JCH5_SYNKA|nr:hypothetical protein SKAU_G00006080 [Synaphobranchus kaupii]
MRVGEARGQKAKLTFEKKQTFHNNKEEETNGGICFPRRILGGLGPRPYFNGGFRTARPAGGALAHISRPAPRSRGNDRRKKQQDGEGKQKSALGAAVEKCRAYGLASLIPDLPNTHRHFRDKEIQRTLALPKPGLSHCSPRPPRARADNRKSHQNQRDGRKTGLAPTLRPSTPRLEDKGPAEYFMGLTDSSSEFPREAWRPYYNMEGNAETWPAGLARSSPVSLWREPLLTLL